LIVRVICKALIGGDCSIVELGIKEGL
jgi:hypothetical protein